MRNLVITLIFLIVTAPCSFAKDKKTQANSPMNNNQETIVSTNQVIEVPVVTTPSKKTKTRSQWDFSDHPEDNKKEQKKSKKKKYSYVDEYQDPNSEKDWKYKKSLTTNNVTTREVGN